MHIQSSVFFVLYEKICIKGLKELNDGQTLKRAKGISSENLFKQIVPDSIKKENFFVHYFGKNHSKNYKYLYRKFSESKNKESINIIDAILFRALKYLGYRTLVDTKSDSLVVPYNENKLTNGIKEMLNYFVDEYSEEIELQRNSYSDDLSNLDITQSDLTKVEKIVNDFYENLSRRQYKNAWNLLTPYFRKRIWDDSLEDFEFGYECTRGIIEICIFRAKKNNRGVYECQIYYEDKLNIYGASEINMLKDVKFESIDDFNEKLNDFLKRWQRIGAKNISKFPITKFCDLSISEALRYSNKLSLKDIKKEFGEGRLFQFKRNFTCTVHKIEGKFLIESIQELKTKSLN